MLKLNLKGKNVRYGGYAALVTIIIIAITLVINIILSSFDMKLDLTKEKFYSLSKESIDIVKHLKSPVTIYVLEETGKENKTFKEILDRYRYESSKVSLVYKDPVLYPQFIKKYTDASAVDTDTNAVPTGSIIVENTANQKYKLIKENELYNMAYDQYGQPQAESIAIEEKVTSAIDYVATDVQSSVIVTSGHTESLMPNSLKSALESKNYTINTINLLKDELPQSPNNMLLILSPHTDFMDAERDKILDYLDKGGRAMIFTDYNTPSLSNFNKILSYYGIIHQPGVVVEGSAGNALTSYPTYILPLIGSHDITNALVNNKIPVLVPLASGLKTADTKRKELTITPLLRSSEHSWLKTNTNAQTLEKESGDVNGPIDIAYAIEDINHIDPLNPVKTRLFIMSNSMFMDETKLNMSGTGNIDFIKNTLLWLQNKNTSLNISPKHFSDNSLPAMTTTHLILFGTISIIIIPFVVIIFGILTWIRRKNL